MVINAAIVELAWKPSPEAEDQDALAYVVDDSPPYVCIESRRQEWPYVVLYKEEILALLALLPAEDG